jgi:hypothetical protein
MGEIPKLKNQGNCKCQPTKSEVVMARSKSAVALHGEGEKAASDWSESMTGVNLKTGVI